MGNPVIYIDFGVTDVEKSGALYLKLFGWQAIDPFEREYIQLRTGGGAAVNVGIFEATEVNLCTSVIPYVSVDDVETYLNKAAELGGKEVMPLNWIPDFGSFAMFSDLDGNVIALLDNSDNADSPAFTSGDDETHEFTNPLLHFEFGVSDYQRATEFYTQLFDWKLERFPGSDYTMIHTAEDGITGGIFQVDNVKYKPYVTAYVNCADIKASYAKALELECEDLSPPSPLPDGSKIAVFKDFDDNLIGLWQK